MRDIFIVGAGGFGREAVWTLERINAAAGETVCAAFRAAAPEDVYYLNINSHDLFYRDSRRLTQEELANGKIALDTLTVPGHYVLTLIAENRFGRYTVHGSVFTVE